jgi:hypothetical protein
MIAAIVERLGEWISICFFITLPFLFIILIAAAIWITWLLLLPNSVLSNPNLSKIEATLAILLTLGIILIYSATYHIIILTSARNRINEMVIFATIIILPLLISGVVQLLDFSFPQILLLSPLPVLFFGQGSITTAILGLCLQLTITGLLTWQFTKQIQKVGESATKALLTKEN